MKILFKYPTRSRPELFKRGIESIINNVESSDYHILVSVDEDDNTAPHCKRFINDDSCTTLKEGVSKNKVHAINRDVNEFIYDWDILVNMSDDMVFIEKGFDNVIREQFVSKDANYKHNGLNSTLTYKINYDQCLHFPDQNQGTNCMTMSIMGRDYYNRDKFIYPPEFESLWCDVVAQEVAQIRGCYKYVPIRIFDHLHPSFGQAVYDEQYRKTEDWGVRQRDYATYLKLKKEYDPTNIFPIRPI